MSKGEPRLAVVIPTRARYTRLAFCVEALTAQAAELDGIELIVVCDEDDPPPPHFPPEGAPVRLVTGPPRATPAAKRNAGWRASDAPLIAFTDDDCRPAEGWLRALLDAGSNGAALLHGPVQPDPDEQPLLTGLARSLVVEEGQPWYPTANLALSRDLLERLDGFDEAFQRAGGEDTDLALRAIDAGAEPRFLEGALVWHAVHTRNALDAIREAGRADGEALLFKRHPEQRREIFGGLFWKRSHALGLLAVAGILAGRRRPLIGVALAAPYVAANVDTGRRMSAKHLFVNALHLPLRFLVDLAETLATLRGAVKDRTPLL